MFPAGGSWESPHSLWGLVSDDALGSPAAPSCSIHKSLQAFHEVVFGFCLVFLEERGVGKEGEVIWSFFIFLNSTIT